MTRLNDKPTWRIRERWLPATIVLVILMIFAAAIGLVTWQQREDIQKQIVERDGGTLHAVVMMLFREDLLKNRAEGVSDPSLLFSVLLRASELKGTIAVRLFDTNGIHQASVPLHVTEGTLPAPALEELNRSRPISGYHPVYSLDQIYMVLPSPEVMPREMPVLEVNVPIQTAESEPVEAVAQFFIEGHSIAAELRRLDRGLFLQAGVIFMVGGLVIGGSILWAFRRLQAKNRELAARTRKLQRANEELALASRTSALGSVAAHLVHGLKNPLSGLQQFMTGGRETTDLETWNEALNATRRMQSMVGEVVRVLRESQEDSQYEITLEELESMVRGRVQSALKHSGVGLKTTLHSGRSLDNRQANLVGLILVNLIQNAIDASQPGSVIQLSIEPSLDEVTFRVADQGPGIPDSVRESLFTPCQSQKDGGCGIGLVIGKQLAAHLGARLELESSSSQGAVFLLFLPVAADQGNSNLAASSRFA